MKSVSLHQTRGLVTNSGQVLTPGDLVQAWNALVRKAGIVEQRRSYETATSGSGLLSGDLFLGLIAYDGTFLIQTLNGYLYKLASSGNCAAIDSATTGLYQLPVPQKPGLPATTPASAYSRSAEMNGNVYFAARTGTWVYGGTAKPRLAGIQSAPDFITLTGVASGTAIPNNSGAAYRVVWGAEDDQHNVIQGPPSGRATFYNVSGGAQNVILSIQMPISVATDIALTGRTYNYYIYRTACPAAAASLAAIPDAGDKMNLIYQSTVSTTQTNNTITYTDVTPDGFIKGPDLYTNAGQGGIRVASYMAPCTYDICEYRRVMYFAQAQSITTGTHTMIGLPDNWPVTTATVLANVVTLNVTLAPDLTLENLLTPGGYVSVTGNSGTGINGDFVLSAVTATTLKYTSVGATGGSGGTAMVGFYRVDNASDFAVFNASYSQESSYTSGQQAFYKVNSSGSTSQQLALTNQSLVRAMNKNTVFNSTMALVARAGDTASDSPGLLRIESAYASAFGAGNSYPVKSAKATLAPGGRTYATTKWYPGQVTGVVMDQNQTINRLYYSKNGEAESVPLTSFFDIGAKTQIRRLMTTRDALYIFKDDGLFRLIGDPNAGAIPTRFDNDIVLLGDNMLALMHNKIYAAATRGLCEISDVGVRWISSNIQDRVNALMDWGSTGDNTIYGQHITANERDGCVFFYMQFLPTLTDRSTKVFSVCYNAGTETWTAVDPLGPHKWPGIYVRTGSFAAGFSGSSIYRHYWSASGNSRSLLKEKALRVGDDPALSTAIVGTPLPGDAYLVNISAAGIGTFSYADTSGWSADLGGGTTTTTVEVGDVLVQTIGSVNYAWQVLTAGTGSGTHAPLGGAPTSMNTGSAFVLKRFTFDVEWAKFVAGDDFGVKHWTGAAVLLDSNSTASATTISSYTELVPTAASQSVLTRQLSQKVLLPVIMQRSRSLSMKFSHSQAGKYVFIEGVGYDYLPHQVLREDE